MSAIRLSLAVYGITAALLGAVIANSLLTPKVPETGPWTTEVFKN